MNRRGSTRRQAERKPVVVLAGEDSNDRKVLRTLLASIRPQMHGRMVEIRDSVRLHKANGQDLAQRTRTLAAKARARAEREQAELACVFVHEDLDNTDGDGHTQAHERAQAALSSELGSAHYVLAVPETEAWMLLFPEALREVAATWDLPARRRGKDTGRIRDPKKVLTNELGKGGARKYRESDAPAVFEAVVDGGHLSSPPVGANRSWSRFVDDAHACCANHLSHQRKRRR